ncbi:MAG: hypothetical protein ACR2HC_03095 [Thermoleophilaceae bacterium]
MTVKIRMVGTLKKLLGGAAGVLAAGGDVVGHARWWLRYQMDGTARDEPGEPSS